VRTIEEGVHTSEANGTQVEIKGFRVRVRLAQLERARRFIAQHLKRYPDAQVFFNGRPLVPPEIPTLPEWDRQLEAPPAVSATAGEAKLLLHVAPESLPNEDRGIYAWITGQRLAFGLLGLEGSAWAARVFGDVEANGLDPGLHPDWPSPFGQGRSESPNLENPGLNDLYLWVHKCVQDLINDLDVKARAEENERETRRLAKIARDIASLLNSDYRAAEEVKMQTASAPGADAARPAAGTEGEETRWTPGDDIPAVPVAPVGGLGGQGEGGHGDPPDSQPELLPTPDGPARARETGADTHRSRPRGGFQVEFRHLGDKDDRGRYDAATGTIIINLDHPEVVWAKQVGGATELAVYREVAMVEYAFALGQRQVENDAGRLSEAATRFLVAVRDKIHRVARQTAGIDHEGLTA